MSIPSASFTENPGTYIFFNIRVGEIIGCFFKFGGEPQPGGKYFLGKVREAGLNLSNTPIRIHDLETRSHCRSQLPVASQRSLAGLVVTDRQVRPQIGQTPGKLIHVVADALRFEVFFEPEF